MDHFRHTAFCATVTAAIVTSAFVGNAGEPIIIPKEKQPPVPTLDQKLPTRDVFRFGEKLNAPTGFDVLTVPAIPGGVPMDLREQKRRKLERRERENWMVVGKGELQAEEEEKSFLDVRDYSLEGLEKEDGRGNLMFRGMNKDGNPRIPGQFRSSKGPLSPPGGRPDSEEEEESKDSPRLAGKDSKQGAHVSTELNFTKMFDPRQESDSLAPRFNKSELTLQRLLGGGIAAETRREQQTRSEEFRNFLDNRGATPLAGPTDPINFGSDFTRRPIQPTTPQPPGGGVGVATANRFGSPSATPRPGSALGGGLPTAFASTPAPAGFSSGPLLAPRTEPVRPMKQMTFDPPRRKF